MIKHLQIIIILFFLARQLRSAATRGQIELVMDVRNVASRENEKRGASFWWGVIVRLADRALKEIGMKVLGS